MRARAGSTAIWAGLLLSIAVAFPVAAADTTPPLANEPFVQFRLGQVTSSATPAAKVLLRAFWAPSTDASGIANYKVQIRRDAGAWTAVGTTSKPRINLSLQPYSACGGCPTGRYTLRISAKDGAGLVGPWREGNRFLVAAYQENHAAVHRDVGWNSPVPLSGAYEGMVSTANTANRIAYMDAGNAQRLAIVATRGAGRGRLRISVDGQFVSTVSLSGTAQARRIVWGSQALSYLEHHLEIKTLDGAPVDIDAILTIGDV